MSNDKITKLVLRDCELATREGSGLNENSKAYAVRIGENDPSKIKYIFKNMETAGYIYSDPNNGWRTTPKGSEAFSNEKANLFTDNVTTNIQHIQNTGDQSVIQVGNQNSVSYNLENALIAFKGNIEKSELAKEEKTRWLEWIKFGLSGIKSISDFFV